MRDRGDGVAIGEAWAANIRIFFMPAFADFLRLAQEIGHGRHRLKWAIGLGGLVQALLVVARARLVWWPLHPLGFAISTLGQISVSGLWLVIDGFTVVEGNAPIGGSFVHFIDGIRIAGAPASGVSG